jgi:RNA polymerase sigma-70 factor (ECF subfamily)
VDDVAARREARAAMSAGGEVTILLARIRSGDAAATDRLIELVYPELRALAGALMKAEARAITLQPTALVHEAYMRLVGSMDEVEWAGRAHFMAVAARSMRQVLVDQARRRNSDKRGSGDVTLCLDDIAGVRSTRESALDVVVLDDVLTRLEDLSERQARVAELKAFAGMTSEEIAHVLDVSVRTVDGNWYVAKAFLRRELAR